VEFVVVVEPVVVEPVGVEPVVVEPVVVEPVVVDVEPAVVVLDEVPEDTLDGIAYPSGCLRAASNAATVFSFRPFRPLSATKPLGPDAVSLPATLTSADAGLAREDPATPEPASKLEPAASGLVAQRAPTGQVSP
jgi:hypothetical protein